MVGDEITADFLRGWNAALAAARDWHQSQATKAMAASRKSRFPKNAEREADVHTRSAEIIATLDPDDV